MLITQGAFMPRPEKCRRIENYPGVTYFKPAGIPIRDLEEISLSPVEIEALRWKEIENLDQEGGAQKMNISRPTFQRILASARYKIADALIKGKAIRIEGGNFEIAARRFVFKPRSIILHENVQPVRSQNCNLCVLWGKAALNLLRCAAAGVK
jgi:predicted DNA-binding protein (UPF0251 family)